MIYFDQAATSFPTLPAVIEEMVYTMEHIGANPGRGTHTPGIRANELVMRTRAKAQELFGVQHVKQCLFFSSATAGLNQAILGYPWQEGDHVIATKMEHNAVRRPLEAIRKIKGIDITYINWNGDEELFIKEVKDAIKPQTKMVTVTHASNITGEILPIEKVCRIVSKDKEITTLIDASQTVGHIPIHMNEFHIDMLVFPGHKGLQGPKGIGMLLVNKEIDMEPIHYGGSGGQALSISPPEESPQRFETGTMNVPAIAGLYASLVHMENNFKKNVSRETMLMHLLVKGLEEIEGITIYGSGSSTQRVPVIAWNYKEIHSDEIGLILDSHYEIAVRSGLHCNALGHEALHTVDQGVVRISINTTNTVEEVEAFLRAVQEIVESYKQLD